MNRYIFIRGNSSNKCLSHQARSTSFQENEIFDQRPFVRHFPPFRHGIQRNPNYI